VLVDAAIVAFVGLFVWRGWKRGLVLSLTGLVGFVLATFAAVYGFRLAAAPLEAFGLSEGVANLAGALAIFLAVNVGMLFLGRTLTRALRWTKFGAVNAAGGGALGGAWALSWLTAVLLAISVLPVPRALASNVDGSALARGIVREAPRWAGALARTDLRRMLTFFVPGDHRISIVATEDFDRLEGAERDLFDLVNEERTYQGRNALGWDDALARAARKHAADMYLRGYFAHESLAGSTPGERMRAEGATFRIAGENIALAPNLRIAHARLMASLRHRRHILDRRFTRVGIGVMFGRQGVLIAEEFAG
jgi:uncharacterized membrane protein required for colicin V production